MKKFKPLPQFLLNSPSWDSIKTSLSIPRITFLSMIFPKKVFTPKSCYIMQTFVKLP